MSKFLFTSSFLCRLLLVVLLFVWLRVPVGAANQTTGCFIEATSSVAPSGDGLYTVTFKPEGGKAPYKFIFYKESGHLVSNDFNKEKFERLKQGKYFAVIVDSKNCRKNLEIMIN